MATGTSDLAILSADIQSYIVAPAAAFGLGGFIFDVEDDAMARLSADITDHYSEDNLAVQDHIARRPRQITLRGFVGEVTYTPNSSNNDQVLQQVVQKLTTVTAYLPQITAATSQVQTLFNSGQDVTDLPLADSANIYGLVKDILGSITGDTPKQQQAFMYFKACWEQGTLMSIQTPWEFITNMVIEEVIAIQPASSKYITDFSIRYKQLRFAQTTSAAYNTQSPNNASSSDNVLGYAGNYPPVVPVTTPQLQGAAAAQAQDPVPIGNVPGLALPTNQLPGTQSQITGVQDILNNPQALKIFENALTPAH